MIVSIPEELKKLREPWFDDSVSQEIQENIRFGSSVYREEDGYILQKSLNGGNTSSWEPISEKLYHQLSEVMKREYFSYSRDETSFSHLHDFLTKRGVALLLGHPKQPKAINPEVADLTMQIYDLLPQPHLGHAHFTQLRLGGWGGRYVGCSEYKSPQVHMFDFAVDHSRRDYCALLLHETGHAHLKLLQKKNPSLVLRLKKNYRKLRQDKIPLFGVDYLLGEENRKEYYSITQDLTEFAAENYLFYVTQGERFDNFVHSLLPEQQKPWRETYNLFKESFGGIEFR